jgi:uncharacterized protein (DUF1499 family)
MRLASCPAYSPKCVEEEFSEVCIAPIHYPLALSFPLEALEDYSGFQCD